tara:strand:+ start:6468 stop:6572 length:105 start_codon:yes stop_codon:yes gene_type:complete
MTDGLKASQIKGGISLQRVLTRAEFVKKNLAILN